MTHSRRFLAPRRVAASCGWLIAIAAVAIPMTSWASSGVSQGFTTPDSVIAAGTLMGLESGPAHIAVPTASAQHYQLLGIVADQPLVALSDASNQVQVVVSGLTEALVSDINGTVHTGDKITVSPITGVGMKATVAGQIVGTAQGNLTDSTLTKRSVTDRSGKTRTINIGSIPLQVNVGYYGGQQDQSKLAAIVPPVLLDVASHVAGQEVSALRVLVGLLALLLGFGIAGHILQTAIRASIIAVGRNPLAKKSIRRQLFDVCLTASGVFVLTLGVIYLIFRV